MIKLSETELLTNTIDDLNLLIPSNKNRSSFLNVEEGAKRGCSRIATLIGKQRTERWVKMLANGLEFCKIAHIPVWDNGNGTFTLGDGHTRIDAIKFLCKEKGMKVPQVSLIVNNAKFSSLEEFENEIITLNGTFSGQKWNICEKIDFLKRQGNVYAQEIFDLYDYFYDNIGKDLAFNLVVNIYLDCQGNGKDGTILNELSKIKNGNTYAYKFADFFIALNEWIENNKQTVKVNIFNQYLLQALFNLYMCAITKHENKIDTFFKALKNALSNATTKEKIISSKRSAEIADELLDRIAKNKDKDEWYNTMKMVRTERGMTDISERGGRCVTFEKEE